MARLSRNWDALDDGSEFIDAEHLYSSDLDLFGPGSMYQLLCSAQTQIGRETLAHWMKSPARREEIYARQQAVAELQARRDLPEAVAAVAPASGSDFQPDFLTDWAAGSSPRFPKWAPIVTFLLPVGLISAPILYGLGFLAFAGLVSAVEAIIVAELTIGALFRKPVKAILESLPALSVELAAMRELLQIMEREQFSSPKLKNLAKQLRQSGTTASICVRRLLRLITLVRQRDNELFTYPSLCLMWGTQFAMAIDRWRCRYGAQMLQWMAILGELEALLSLSTYSYEHPGDPFPEVVSGEPLFDSEGIGHPLLDENTCVRNDFQLGDGIRFLIVSGSNMSGKSTFLRAIGLNAVLAYMGAPVRCAKLRLSMLEIGAAVRIRDSVVDGRSHFQAEMLRLRRIIDAAGHRPLLFLADEIMGGTNSHDRRIATEWVIRALILRGAVGAISTHDLALTEIAMNGLPGSNVHSEDSGESGKLEFDYKLRPGILTHSNALNIARMLGIDTAAQQR
jgi:DNA mismatch repair ATPase MutS